MHKSRAGHFDLFFVLLPWVFPLPWSGSSCLLLVFPYHSVAIKKMSFGVPHTFSSVQFSHSVMSNSLQLHESQHARPPCPSPSPGVHSDSCPSSQWCHPAISSSVVPFSSCPQSLPASESFPMSQHFAWGIFNSLYFCTIELCRLCCPVQNPDTDLLSGFQVKQSSVALCMYILYKAELFCSIFFHGTAFDMFSIRARSTSFFNLGPIDSLSVGGTIYCAVECLAASLPSRAFNRPPSPDVTTVISRCCQVFHGMKVVPGWEPWV